MTILGNLATNNQPPGDGLVVIAAILLLTLPYCVNEP